MNKAQFAMKRYRESIKRNEKEQSFDKKPKKQSSKAHIVLKEKN